VTRSFVAETLWPEFQRLSETLRGHLDAVTKRVISQAICGDVADAETRSEHAGRPEPGSGGTQADLILE